MSTEHKTPLTSAEIGNLWTQYIIDTMSLQIEKFHTAKEQDEQARAIMQTAVSLLEKVTGQIRQIFQNEGIPLPQGFTDEILLFGSFVAVGRILMDIIGSNAVLWSYDIRETPFYPSPFLHDFTVTPLALMVVYQYCHSWKKFLAWTAVVTGIISFAFFPIFTALGFLKFYNWNYFYSFVLIIGIASLSRWVLLGVLSIQRNYEYAKDESKTLNYQPAMKPFDTENDNREDEN